MSAKQRKRIEKLEHQVRQLRGHVRAQEMVVANEKRRAEMEIDEAREHSKQQTKGCILFMDARYLDRHPETLRVIVDFDRLALSRYNGDNAEIASRMLYKLMEHLEEHPPRPVPRRRDPIEQLMAISMGARPMPAPRSNKDTVEAKPGGTRAEHLAWCKLRALEYCDRGDTQQAFDSMVSDLTKHDALRGHIGAQLGMSLLMNGHLAGPGEMRKWIEGFN